MINVKLLKSNPIQNYYRKKNKNQNDISTDNKKYQKVVYKRQKKIIKYYFKTS